MAIRKIKDIDTLIKQYIDGESKMIVDIKISNLTAPGENFGSEILKVDLFLKTKDTGKTEEWNVVAKLIPTSDFFKEIFNVQVTFKRESKFYETIVPTLQEFQKSHGVNDVINIFPRFFGSRNNLKSDDHELVDDDAVLIIENLKVNGYVNVDRHIGFDLPTTQLILKHLAQIHAIPLALKLNNPNAFETKIKPFLACFNSSGTLPPPPPINRIVKLMEESEKCKPLVPKVLKSFEHSCQTRKTFKEPMATMVHKDLWINNIMVKFNGDSPTHCKFVDFQMYSYDSPASDLLFFLFTSVELGVLQNNLNDFLDLYCQHFTNTLRTLSCNLTMTRKQLQDEISFSAEWELAHIIFMSLFIILSKKGGPASSESGVNGEPDLSKITFTESATTKVLWILEEWENRGWLLF